MSKVYEALKKAETERFFEEMKKEGPSPSAKSYINSKQAVVSDSLKGIDDVLIILTDPESQAAEQFKKLRTRILQRSKDKNQTLLITSSLPEEGKSVTVANLAISFALNPNTHALLIDADFRNPTLHRFFKLQYQYGLSDYLEGKVEISKIFYKTFVSKLSLIPAGHSKLHPSELLASDKMKNLIKEVKERYPDRFIFIDSTPMLITSEPDILANQVDGTLIVVCYGKTQQDALKRSLDLLKENSVWGIVFNKVNPKSMRYRHSYYYYYKKKKTKDKDGMV